MSDNTEARRRDMIELVHKQGKTPTEASRELAEKYEAEAVTIQSDWSRRQDWNLDLVGIDLEKADQLLSDSLVTYRLAQSELWEIYRSAESKSVQLGAIKELMKSGPEMVDLLQSLGIIEKEPEKFEGKIEKEVKELNLSWEKIEKELKLPGDKDDYIEAYEKATLEGSGEEGDS